MSEQLNKIAYFKCLRGAKLPDGAVRVLVALYTYSNADGGNARPGIKRLADDCCMAESSVSRHLKLLADREFIRQERRGGRSGDKQTWASTYRLCIPGSPNTGEPSTAQNREVDNESQPLNSESQPLNSSASTSQNREPTKSVTPSQLSPSPPSLRSGGSREASSRPPTREEQGLHPVPESEWDEPPKHCPLHPDDTTEPCIPCKIQRQENEAWWDTIDDREDRFWREHPDELAKRREEDEQARLARQAELDARFGNEIEPVRDITLYGLNGQPSADQPGREERA